MFVKAELSCIGTGRAQKIKGEVKRKYVADKGSIPDEKNAEPFDELLDDWDKLATFEVLGPIPDDIDELKVHRARLTASQVSLANRQRNARKNRPSVTPDSP